MDANATTPDSTARAETNGHAGAEPVPPRTGHLFVPVAFWVGCGVALIAFANAGWPLWARATLPLADDAVAFVAIGSVTFAAIFLPVLAVTWRAAIVNCVASCVVLGFAGAIQGSPLSALSTSQAKLLLLLGAISTFWICLPDRPPLRRFAWCVLLIWAIGLPAAGYLTADFDGEQGVVPTLLHFSTIRLLQ